MKRKFVGLLTKFWPLALTALAFFVLPLPATAELVSHWTFDEGSGTTVSDLAGSNDGTLVNGPKFVSGKYGQALSFDGVDDYVDFGTDKFGLDQTNELTIVFWLRFETSAVSKYKTLIVRGPYSYPFQIQLYGNKIRTFIRSVNNTAGEFLFSSSALAMGEWHQVAVTYKNGSRAIYVDGVLSAENGQTGVLTSTANMKTTIGAAIGGSTTYPFDGKMDDLRIYNNALSGSEITSLYNDNSAPVTPPETPNPTNPPACTPNWSCSSWATCSSAGSQTRTCSDTNACGVTTGKPITSQTCAYVPPATGGATYYVDFAGGNDSNSGTSQSSAWKHSPGDANATGNATRTLQPGDTVQFRGGVVYRGKIKVNNSGSTAKQITFKGEGWGSGKAIIEGSEPLAGLVKCTETRCAGKNIYVANLPAGVTYDTANLVEGETVLQVSQYPKQPDAFFTDDVGNFKALPAGKITTTSITDAGVFNQPDPNYWNDSSVMVWVLPNVINIRKIKSYSPADNRITFDTVNDPTGYNKYSIYNSFPVLTQPGEYYISDSAGKIYVIPKNNIADITVSVRDYGFDTSSKSYITVDGFEIRKQSGNQLRNGIGVGDAVSSYQEQYRLIAKNNYIHKNRNEKGGYGAIYFGHCNDCIVEDNLIKENLFTFGIFINNGSNALIKNNTLTKVGRTPISFFGMNGGKVIGNYLFDNAGVHSNGLTFYLDCKDILIKNNIVLNSRFSLTYSDISNLRVINNIFVAPSDTKSVANWGGVVKDVSFYNNVIFNKGTPNPDSLHLKPTDVNTVVKNNILGGVCNFNSVNSVFSNNLYTNLCYSQSSPYKGVTWKPGLGEIYGPNFKSIPWTDIFIDPANNNFRLKPGSLAIDKGVGLSGVADVDEDIIGTGRPQGVTWDIGPYEYYAGAPVCAPSWSCSSWSTCSTSNTQTRTCNDIKACGVSTGKPALTQSCTYTSPTTGVVTPPTTSTGGSSSSHSGGGGGGGSSSNTKSNNPAPVTTVTVTETLPKLVGPFAPGMRTEQVKVLQQYLSRDSSIYPEAIVDGYYSDSVTKAVQRFQSKYGLVSSGDPYTTAYGLAGPATRAKITEVLGVANSTTDSAKAATIAALKKQITELITLLISMLQAQIRAGG